MERYNVIEKIADGVLASVFKVNDKKDQSNSVFVLKEVECFDVTSAKNALNEYRLYHSFQNKSVCKIHDCFIKWDNKISSVFVCYLMDYFEEGLLKEHLNRDRSLQQMVPIDIVENWLGSIIDGMFLFHKNDLVHRNLKPSSLYVKTGDGVSKLSIGDFGPSVIMKDIRSSTRLKSGVFNYHAPEIMDAQDFNEKSDIWNIGTILLDICTTSLYDHETFQYHLLNIRHDEDLLVKILKDVYKIYNSKSLLKLLKLMLNRENNERVVLESIINDDFVQRCLQTIGSDLVFTFSEGSKKNVMLPKERTVKATVEFINSIRSEKTVEAGMERLKTITENQDFDISIDENQKFLIGIMRNFPNSMKIQSYVLKFIEDSLVNMINMNTKLRHESVEEVSPPYLQLDPKFLEKFFYLFLENDSSKDSLIKFIRVLLPLTHFDQAVDQLADFNIIKYLFEVIRKNISDTELCTVICKVIWSLSTNDKIRRTFPNQQSLSVMRTVLINQQKNQICIEMACNVVIALTTNPKVILEEEVDVDLTSAILIVLENHLDVPKIVNSCCMALTVMINLLEEVAFRFIYLPASDINNEISGIDLLTEAYERHKDKSEIVLNIVSVFKELSDHDEMLIEMKSLNMHENLIADMNQRFRDNIEISDACMTVISRIEARIKQEFEEQQSIQMAAKTKSLWRKLQAEHNPAIF